VYELGGQGKTCRWPQWTPALALAWQPHA